MSQQLERAPASNNFSRDVFTPAKTNQTALHCHLLESVKAQAVETLIYSSVRMELQYTDQQTCATTGDNELIGFSISKSGAPR